MVQVHQFHPSIAYGDAVGNSIREIKKILIELGYESEIFAQHIDPKITKIKRYSDYSKYSSHENILIVHYSIGYDWDVLNFIKSLPDKKILIYHNITPSDYFRGVNDTYEYFTKRGRDELKEFIKIVSIALGDSQFNENELRATGFKNTDVLPIPLDFAKYEIAGSPDIIRKYSDGAVNILTVARVCPNKKIEDVIKSFYYYKKAINPKSRLFLVGSSEGMDNYYSQLMSLINRLELEDVFFTGHVSFEELVSYYRCSQIFITLSEHEGFCVPLLESMFFGIPIIAYNSSAIPYTMGDAGILINEKDPIVTAELFNLLTHESAFRDRIIRKEKAHLELFNRQVIKEKLFAILSNVDSPESVSDITYQIEGPFDSSYSLAIVNREMALALDQLYPDQVSLFSTEGPGDYEPDKKFLSRHEDVSRLWNKSKHSGHPKVVARNLYPPRVQGMDGKINILNTYGWEESAFPRQYIDDFNQYLNGITVMSDFVKKILIDNGVRIPVKPVGVGVNHILKITPMRIKENLGSKFKFLHISSGFPRKGIDILLKAYTLAFTKKDDVTLIIKTFPNVHNSVEDQIKKIQQDFPDCPDIILLNRDMEDGFILDLYNQSDVLVAPSRGEGFGLPIAEAMLFGLPVITTGFGGQCDFCNEENSWLIRYTFERAETHMELDDSVWAEPDVDHLAELMRLLKKLPEDEIAQKTEIAKNNIRTNFKWSDCALRLDNFVKELDKISTLSEKKIKLGWVTSWNTKCGIASYSRFMLNSLDTSRFDLSVFASTKEDLISRDEPFVFRCWENNAHQNLSDLIAQIIDKEIDVLVIQFNFGFFDLKAFESLIKKLQNEEIKIIIFFHSTSDVIVDGRLLSLRSISSILKRVDRLFVHSINDLNRMKQFGLVENVSIFPQGVLRHGYEDSVFIKKQFDISDRKIIATYGFLLPHKGISEIIRTFEKLWKTHPEIHLLLVNAIYPIQQSIELKAECLNLIDELNISDKVTFIWEYLTDEESILLLKCADLIVFPYQNTQESSSAAIRHGIASLRPVVCTPLSIFDDVSDIVHFLPGNTPEEMLTGLSELLDDEERLYSKTERQKGWIKNHSWEVLSHRLQNIIQSFLTN